MHLLMATAIRATDHIRALGAPLTDTKPPGPLCLPAPIYCPLFLLLTAPQLPHMTPTPNQHISNQKPTSVITGVIFTGELMYRAQTMCYIGL